VIGRYILTPNVFDELERKERGAGNEIQLTDALARIIGKSPFHGYRIEGTRYDCGDKVGFLHANIAVGLTRPDIAGPLRDLIKTLKL
jgi:UTP--glucose-1-phosphate uridylyltransferase